MNAGPVNDVATFAQQLKQDGIDAARIEAERILADARNQATAIETQARQNAERLRAEAEAQSRQLRERAEAEMRLVARDLIGMAKAQLDQVLLRVLALDAAKALSDRPIVEGALREVLRDCGRGDWTLTLGESTANALGADALARLFGSDAARVAVRGKLAEAGFEVVPPEGNQVLEITASSVAEQFRRLLAPELAKLVDAARVETTPGSPAKAPAVSAGKR